jgi:tungstate transport system substrate-binding protein
LINAFFGLPPVVVGLVPYLALSRSGLLVLSPRRNGHRPDADQTPDALSKEKWYRDIGGGKGQALNAASAMDAYTLSDRGTWLSFNNKGSLVIAVEGDPRLINRYDVIELNPQKHAGTKLTAAKVFADWLVSSEGQQAIGAYQVNGQKLFNPSAGSPK